MLRLRYFLSIGILFLLLLGVSLRLPTSDLNSTIVNASNASGALQNYKIVQYPLPKGSTQPWGMTVDKSGRVWFVEEQSNQIGMFNPMSASFAEYNVTTPKALLEEIATSADGRVWFTELDGNKLGELNPSTGSMQEYNTPRGIDNLPCGPIGVTAAPNGNIWITCEFSNQLDEFFPSNSSFISFNLPVFYSAPLDIVFDGAGNFWFTAADSDMLGYVTVANLRNGTDSGIQEFAPTNQTYLVTITNSQVPNTSDLTATTAGQKIVSSLQTPSEIALSPDGNSLWITEHLVSSFDRYDINSKSLTKYWTSQTYSSSYSTSLPNGIAVDSAGHVWIAEHYGNRIAEFDPSSDQMIEYPIPCCGNQIAGALYLSLGLNGTIWFTEFYGNSIGELIPQNEPQPISLVPLNATSTITSNGNVEIPISVVSHNTNSTPGNITLLVSGISGSGRMENATVTFDPPVLALNNQGNTTTRFGLTAKGLQPGTYYLTVGGKLSSTGVIYSTIVKLKVSSANQSQTLLLEGAAIGTAASIAVVATLIVISRRPKVRKKRHR